MVHYSTLKNLIVKRLKGVFIIVELQTGIV